MNHAGILHLKVVINVRNHVAEKLELCTRFHVPPIRESARISLVVCEPQKEHLVAMNW